ncbi:TATE DNA Transposon [Trypanosoma theileri]|uniref:TATE DNA Transposon n=1 Tax=Trypanosoma theileri TaxID=67003 RepID=A0A1X0P2P3_9TRYP|nr:TATE DNA Transposon [Trypanosoma theileri]ORC91165.1 TATE DNA Transposon [Trypanosoma theileri]
MTPARAKEIEHLFPERESDHLFFPIFIRHHWIAGIFSVTKGKKPCLTIYDSAPSPIVQRDLVQAIRSWWPQIELYEGKWVRQERYSEDCGIFVTARFFATFLQLPIRHPKTLPKRLRPYLQEVTDSATKLPKKQFLTTMGRILLNQNGSKLLGGGENTNAARDAATDLLQMYSNVSDELRRRQLGYMWVASALANLADGASRSLTVDSIAMRANRYKFASSTPHDVADAIVRLGFPVFGLGRANRGDRHESLLALPEEGTQEANCLLHPALFVQTGSRSGLPPVIQAGNRPESGEPLPERNFILGTKFTGSISRKKGASSGHYTPTRNPKEAVIGVYRPADEANWPPYTGANASTYRKRKGRQDRPPATTTTTTTTTTAAPRQQQQQTTPSSKPTPTRTKRARLEPTQPRTPHRQQHHQQQPQGKRTRTNAAAAASSLLRQGEARRDDTRPKHTTLAQPSRTDRSWVSVVRGETAGAGTLQQNAEQLEEVDALQTPHSLRLNGNGKRPMGYACPRHWVIYPDKPPHISQLAWAAVTPAQRKGHIHWLRELRQMPEDLITASLPEAAIELVRRAAVARGWKWTTICKALALIKGALLNLPLYTNQRESIDIGRNPSWRAATQAAHRFERRAPTNPPAPVTYAEMQKAHKALARECPQAALFLMMMWCSAARAGDIGSLHAEDVRVERVTEGKNMARLTMTMRYGKGARFRGPYPVGAMLPREDASVLQHLLSQRLPHQRLFQDVTAIRNKVRQALRSENPLSALPSIRKGATRHLAAHGVSEEHLMRMTGHTRIDTLRRYLGYGLQMTREAEHAQDSAARALLERSS